MVAGLIFGLIMAVTKSDNVMFMTLFFGAFMTVFFLLYGLYLRNRERERGARRP